MHNISPELRQLSADNGRLPAYAWPGGYPMFYLDNHDNVLCPDCANKADEYSEAVLLYDVNWDDTMLSCDECGRLIESAYGEDG
jgi:ribosomal protein S27E